MQSRLVYFDIHSLLDLLIHRTDGLIPISARPVDFLHSTTLNRLVAIVAESPEWHDPSPLIVRLSDDLHLVHNPSTPENPPVWRPSNQ